MLRLVTVSAVETQGEEDRESLVSCTDMMANDSQRKDQL